MNISMKLIDQYMDIFFNFPPKSNHLHPLQVENCDSNLRLVVDEDDNGKFRLEKVKALSDSFEYLVMGLRPLEIFLILQCENDFRRQILTSTYVRFRRLRSIPAL